MVALGYGTTGGGQPPSQECSECQPHALELQGLHIVSTLLSLISRQTLLDVTEERDFISHLLLLLLEPTLYFSNFPACPGLPLSLQGCSKAAGSVSWTEGKEPSRPPLLTGTQDL